MTATRKNAQRQERLSLPGSSPEAVPIKQHPILRSSQDRLVSIVYPKQQTATASCS